jgi:hypothetical protein
MERLVGGILYKEGAETDRAAPPFVFTGSLMLPRLRRVLFLIVVCICSALIHFFSDCIKERFNCGKNYLYLLLAAHCVTIWIRLPQVSSNMAIVTGPAWVGFFLNTTPSFSSRSYSCCTLATPNIVQGMEASNNAF